MDNASKHLARTRRRCGLVLLGTLLSGCLDTGMDVPVSGPFIDPGFDVTVDADIVYGTGAVRLPSAGDKDLLLDVYRPTDTDFPPLRPGLVLMHGGGFATGDRTNAEMALLGEHFAALGYVVASVEYRMIPDDPPTELISVDPNDSLRVAAAAAREDAALAVAWLRDHADDYRVDPTRIAVGGFEAGAITALGVAYWNRPAQHADVRAALSLSGGMLGSQTQIDYGEPPAFLVHGQFDPAALDHGDVVTRLQDVRVEFEAYRLTGAGENTWENLDYSVQNLTIWEWLERFFYRFMDLDPLAGDAWPS